MITIAAQQVLLALLLSLGCSHPIAETKQRWHVPIHYYFTQQERNPSILTYGAGNRIRSNRGSIRSWSPGRAMRSSAPLPLPPGEKIRIVVGVVLLLLLLLLLFLILLLLLQHHRLLGASRDDVVAVTRIVRSFVRCAILRKRRRQRFVVPSEFSAHAVVAPRHRCFASWCCVGSRAILRTLYCCTIRACDVRYNATRCEQSSKTIVSIRSVHS